ncbi:MAG: hypothetical protein NZ959_02265 [Armatimonadetes bacterium]|nr:hypothetical protein [Armatimonadota bacterium]MDW8121001.1 hypothetical protein [Armatimonadota bacterium]
MARGQALHKAAICLAFTGGLFFFFFFSFFATPLWSQRARTEKVWDQIWSLLQQGLQSRSEREKQAKLEKAYRLLQSLPSDGFTRQWETVIEAVLYADRSTASGRHQREQGEAWLRWGLSLASAKEDFSKEEAHLVISRILAGFSPTDRWAPVREWWRRTWSTFAKWLQRPVDWVAHHLSTALRAIGRFLLFLSKPILEVFRFILSLSPVLAWSLLVITLAAVTFLITLYALRILEKRQSAVALGEEGSPLEQPEQLWALAQSLAQQGNYLEAIRLLYRGTLVLFDSARLCSFREEKTNREYVSEVMRVAPIGVASAFSEMTRRVDRCLYRDKTASGDDFEYFWSQTQHFQKALVGIRR